MSSHQHFSGSLKQANKKHKSKVGQGKRSLKLSQGGKVQNVKPSKSQKDDALRLLKNNRINQANQIRKNKRSDALIQRRVGSNHGPPRVIAVIPITDGASIEDFLAILSSQSDQFFKISDLSNTTFATFSSFKSRCLFIEPRSRELSECLEISKSADAVILLSKDTMLDTSLIDEFAMNLLSVLRSVGCPELIGVIQSSPGIDVRLSSDPAKIQLHEGKIALQKYLQNNFQADCKVFDESNNTQLNLLCRHISTSTCTVRTVSWKCNRSNIVSDFSTMGIEGGGLVSFKGYIRGRPMALSSLVHIENIGTCRLVQVAALAQDPYSDNRYRHTTMASPMVLGQQYAIADPTMQDSLTMEASPDIILGEQTWPIEDEMQGADAPVDGSNPSRKLPNNKKLPKGMSSYQADWLVGEDGEWNEDDDDAEGNDDDDDDDNASAAIIVDDDDANDDDDDANDDDDAKSDDDDVAMSPLKAFSPSRTLQQQADDDLQFPDELDTPDDVGARVRFARYRALQSFRSSPWHPKENLPTDYARIYQFENFIGAQKRILDRSAEAERRQQEMLLSTFQSTSQGGKSSRGASFSGSDAHSMEGLDEEASLGTLHTGKHSKSACSSRKGQLNSLTVHGLNDFICSDQYVSITVEVPAEIENSLLEIQRSSLGLNCNIFSLHMHENKLSVLHFKIQRTDNYTEPIKGKEELIFQVGFRSFKTKPIFSEANLNCDKHKYERFLRHGQFTVASCYGPITFAPCPVLVFKELAQGVRVLVATGSFSHVDPNRIILKKVILTGVPIRVRKKFAVIRHLLHDPMDVRWFKPAELATKHGLRGNITDSVGTHGLFKAQFNAPIKQNDTVMLILYKRVFPKFPAQGIDVK